MVVVGSWVRFFWIYIYFVSSAVNNSFSLNVFATVKQKCVKENDGGFSFVISVFGFGFSAFDFNTDSVATKQPNPASILDADTSTNDDHKGETD